MEDTKPKLFIENVPEEATEATLHEHFSQYGVVSGTKLIIEDRVGFVCFSDPSSAIKALQDSLHHILGKKVKAKICEQHPRRSQEPMMSQPQQSQSSNFETRRIFVGGIYNVTKLELRNYFEKFGRVTGVVVKKDKFTRRPRGFGFVGFESEDSVEEVLRTGFHEISGEEVSVKKAVRQMEESNREDRRRQPGSTRFDYTGSRPGLGGFASGTCVYGGCIPAGGYIGIPYGIPYSNPQKFYPVWTDPYHNAYYYPYMNSVGGWPAATGLHNMYNRVSEPAMYQPGSVIETENVPADVNSSGVEDETLDDARNDTTL